LENFFFDEVPFPAFERLFANFIYEEKQSKDVIIKENSPMKYIYFIKEGNIEITTSKSLLELSQLIKKLIEKKLVNTKGNSLKLLSFDKGPFSIPLKILKEKFLNII
jgi:signal-transduction protein with cAMP-binding, CBS, and nucleotidyltransferase domain